MTAPKKPRNAPQLWAKKMLAMKPKKKMPVRAIVWTEDHRPHAWLVSLCNLEGTVLINVHHGLGWTTSNRARQQAIEALQILGIRGRVVVRRARKVAR